MKRRNVLLLFIICFTLASCVSSKKYSELEARERGVQSRLNNCDKERSALKEENASLQNKLNSASEKITDLTGENAKLLTDLSSTQDSYSTLQDEFSKMQELYKNQLKGKNVDLEKARDEYLAASKELEKRSAELSEKEKRLTELENILSSKEKETEQLKKKITDALLGFEGKGLSIYVKNGKVYVSMEEKLLFASGSWEIAAEGKKALKEVAKVLESNPDINVMIEGHTDNVPYKGRNDVKDNWDLSVMRSTSVVKMLLSDSQIDPKRISASGRGEFLPVQENNSVENKAKNRRTEIILTPKLDELFTILKD